MEANMYIEIDNQSEIPIYQQIADAVREFIAGGKLVPGDRLPSVRQLAVDLGINLNTVATSYRSLQEEGLISIRHGAGAMVASHRSTTADTEKSKRAFASAITDLILSGMSGAQIEALLKTELRRLGQKIS